MTKEEGKTIIQQKVIEFGEKESFFMKKGHGETNIRSNFIDVFFKALGWDMESYFDVRREFSQKDNSATKKVDYAFMSNGKLKFFVEAKEVSVDLENNKDAIYQAKRYAFSTNGKAPIVILTDFQEFRVFNVLKAPLFDNTDRELLKNHCMRYTDYIDKWDLLWETFSKEAVSNGSLNKLVGKIDKNTKLMDVEFLEQITSWRETLAKHIALRNKDLTVDEINESVQRILDRLIFIRNLEDREIEEESTLLKLINTKENIYKNIIPLFNKLDDIYNGLLFKKHFSEALIIDDKVIKDLIKNICPPVSPFQFDVIEPEILGRIYEKFLGSKIRLTEGHQVKIEEKIEVRKAGGVYYTPEYIVNYIVENTVGKKIEGLTPKEIEQIKILDPACGSGSFLLGAYSYLLKYHEKFYTEHKNDKKYKDDFYITKEGEFKVKLDKRAEILKNNIFGVDIDKEATEVAIMSLYLKMLDEGFDKGQKELFFLKGHILPDMSGNVKCGNSLIGSDYFDEKLDFNDEEFKKINPFNWNDGFKEVFKNGGFDVVIGNPPYILIQDVNRNDNYLNYYREKYSSSSYKIDTYHIFIEKGINLLKDKGLIGYITPSNYMTNNGLEKLRDFILKNSKIININVINGNIFIDASVDTCISILQKSNENINSKLIFSNWDGSKLEGIQEKIFEQERFEKNENYLFTSTEETKLNINCFNLGDNYSVKFGMQLRDRKKYLVDVITKDQKELITSYHKECYTGKDVGRYYMGYSNLLAYVNREAQSGGCWDEKVHLTNPKIIVRQIGKTPICCLDENGYYCLNTVFMIIPKNENQLSIKFILGIINSSFIQKYWTTNFYDMRQTFPKIKGSYLEKLPIPSLDLTNKEHKQAHDTLVTLVENMLQTQKDQRNAKSEQDKNLFQQKITMLDKKIDNLVYKLYNLTEDEIKIIEGN